MTFTVADKNRDAIKQICDVYVSPKSLVLDPTYGKGMFWKFEHGLNLVTSDKFLPAQIKADFCCLPFETAKFDAVVFDPPYYAGEGDPKQTKYFIREKGVSVRDLYVLGLVEVSRTVKNKGIIVVKCTDGCPYYPMMPWILNLGSGKYLDVVIKINLGVKNFHPSKVHHKLRTCHSYFIVLQNINTGRKS